MIIRLHRSGGCELICDVPKCFALLSAMPGRKKWLDRKLIFQPSGANIEFITNTWPDAQWIDGADEHREKWLAIKMQEQNTREDKKEQLQDDSGYIYKTVPFIHQKQAFLLGKDKKGFAWFHEQGCGKTKVALDVFAYRFEQNLVDALLIVAPNGVHANWIINEVPAHLPDRLRTECYVYSAGMKRAEAEAIHKASHCPVKRKCIIAAFNVEGFVSEKAQSLFDNFLANHRCMVVVDESSTIQNPSAKRTKYIIKAGRKAVYKCILNGTPITRGIENVYSQFKFLDPLILGHDSFYTFRAQYCIMGGFEFKQIVGYKHIQELSNTIDGHSHRVLKADCLDLPEKIYKRHFFEMTPAQRIAYDTVRRSALEELEEVFGQEHGRELAKEIAITRLIRLQQIVCGWVPFSAGEKPVALTGGNPRLDALLTLLQDVDGKAIIWVTAPNSIADIALIASHLERSKYGFVEYHGSVGTRQREFAIDRFQNDPKVKWFLASKAACMGLTLTAADQAFYYTNNFDLRIRLQSEDRNHRIGSEIHDKILYTDIYTSGIDKKIVSALRNKKSLADQITKDPASLFME